MGEKELPRDKPTPPQFGEKLSASSRRSKQPLATSMFSAGNDLPLFSNTPISATEKPYIPEDVTRNLS